MEEEDQSQKWASTANSQIPQFDQPWQMDSKVGQQKTQMQQTLAMHLGDHQPEQGVYGSKENPQVYRKKSAKEPPHQQRPSGGASQGKIRSKTSTHSKKSDKGPPLPIEKYQPGKISVLIHTSKTTQQESVVSLKRTVKNFTYLPDDFYRDKGTKRNRFVNQDMPQDKELKKFHKHRYYLFIKYDRGIKIDEESWYSITPENVSKHVANKVNSIFQGQTNAIDGFSGVGGNLIQLPRKTPKPHVYPLCEQFQQSFVYITQYVVHQAAIFIASFIARPYPCGHKFGQVQIFIKGHHGCSFDHILNLRIHTVHLIGRINYQDETATTTLLARGWCATI